MYIFCQTIFLASINYRFPQTDRLCNREWRDLTKFSFDTMLCAPWKSSKREYIAMISIDGPVDILFFSVLIFSFGSGVQIESKVGHG